MIQIHSPSDDAPYSYSSPNFVLERPLQLILAEDDPDFARAVVRRFSGSQSARYRVVCLSNLDALFVRLEMRRPDAILLDLSLLDSRGAKTLTYACSVAHLVPIVVLTANADPELVKLALRAGACDYLIKSWHDFACIERTVLRAIRRWRRSSYTW